MSAIPWSAKGTKAIPVDADKFLIIDSEDVPGPTQNKLTTLAGILDSVSSSQVLLVKDQADLEAQFDDAGDIVIPDGESWSVVILESFTLSKPIKIGLNSTLEFRGAALNIIITYTGTGAMFQNENPANLINTLVLRELALFSSGVEALFDIVGSARCRLEQMNIVKFESLGTIEAMFITIPSTGTFDINEGLLIIEPQGVRMGTFSHIPPTARSLVFITIIATGNPNVIMTATNVFNSSADVVFFDPSSGAISDYSIQNTRGFFNSLFVPGTDLAIASVSDSGGDALFDTGGPAHGYSIGDRIVLNEFLVETNYNLTGIINTTPSGSTFTVVGVSFTATDSGNTTQASRDSTDVTVRAENNTGNPDSMFTGDAGLEIFGSEVTVTINTIDVPEVITNAGWAFSGLERFEIGVNNEGQLNTLDTATRRYSIGYSGTIEKVGGGSVNVGIVLLKNGSLVSFNPPHTVNTGKIQISGSDIVELTKDDTLQVAVINYLDTSNIDVSQIGLVVNLA